MRPLPRMHAPPSADLLLHRTTNKALPLSCRELSNNRLSGSIPTQVGQVSELSYALILWGNRLSGTVPTQVGLLSELSHALFLQRNSLSGTLPTEIFQLTKLSNFMQLSSNRDARQQCAERTAGVGL